MKDHAEWQVGWSNWKVEASDVYYTGIRPDESIHLHSCATPLVS